MSGVSNNAFGQLRVAFHALCDLPEEARAQAMADWWQRDAALAAQLQGLLAHLDAKDLHAPGADLPRFGPFQARECIGSGGMADVFRAERVSGDFDQVVALKRLRASRLDGAQQARFAQERKLLARLDHPNIARLIDGGIGDEGQAWLAMELVDGASWAEWIARTPGYAERLAVFRQVAEAVDYAHRHLVVHRDIKPSNIRLTRDGLPKLLDFGIAKGLDEDAEELTQSGQRLLTWRYAAPEQILGQAATTATDIHGLGVLLFELLSSESPHGETTGAGVPWAARILQGPTRRLPGQLALLNAPRSWQRRGLEALLARCLEKAPERRYPSVAALLDDLDDLQHERVLRSGTGGFARQWRWRVWRHRRALGVATVVLLVAVIGVVSTLRQAQRAEQQAARAEARLSALLDVIGGAVPTEYSGHEPRTVDLLLAAATRLQQRHADDPLLLRQSLGDIGHALLNQGHSEAAVPVLRAALQAQSSERDASPAVRLSLLKLLAFTLELPTQRSALRALAGEAQALSSDSRVSASQRMDVLGSVAGALSKQGDFDLAFALLDQAGPAQDAGDIQVSARENFLRQKGWVALRAEQFRSAMTAFVEAVSVIESQSEDFVPMRRAEAYALLAQAALGAGDHAAALSAWKQAWPEYQRAFPEGHVERELVWAIGKQAEGGTGTPRP
ncbi:MAG: serine/threonine protein kinase [Xanthomonadales bacterium]|nr:serine/threonine protein kinase [Xanthomonadales bacterium]